ncbi:MAG: hypothetical protein WCE81_03655 [Halobacteriota archaeon]
MNKLLIQILVEASLIAFRVVFSVLLLRLTQARRRLRRIKINKISRAQQCRFGIWVLSLFLVLEM